MVYNFKYCIFPTPASIKTVSFPPDGISDTTKVVNKATNLFKFYKNQAIELKNSLIVVFWCVDVTSSFICKLNREKIIFQSLHPVTNHGSWFQQTFSEQFHVGFILNLEEKGNSFHQTFQQTSIHTFHIIVFLGLLKITPFTFCVIYELEVTFCHQLPCCQAMIYFSRFGFFCPIQKSGETSAF